MSGSDALAAAESRIRAIPDYPQSGVVFRDVAPLIADGPSLRASVEAMLAPFAGGFDVVAGVEARGFLLAGVAAAISGVGILPVRKSGKLPRPAASEDYALEYDTATIEVQADVQEGSRVLLLDDVLATGGTLDAATALVRRIGLEPVGIAVLLELLGLGGRERLAPDIPVHAVFTA
ncbi:MAG TPA: adenine phosphoribosyltransferase [Candidatus Agrococcus pullicola]|uniref:Adenine phosphoribosyltransferase n=1 Tax=Candidatus Agrococcus pullicola TaxID=2838429 RepID=A0A9D2C8Q0_9MICO|nr:adenine phosphoribosyltransferase [Candidatus Agrococcus pullicola]